MRAPSSLLSVAAAILLAYPAATSALVTGHRHDVHRRDVGPPPASSAVPVPAPTVNPSHPQGGNPGPKDKLFRLNVINRLPADKPLYVYITGYDREKREGFIRPPADAAAGAQWFIPDARGEAQKPVLITEQLFQQVPGGGDPAKPKPLSLLLPTAIESGRIYFSESPLNFSTVLTAGDRPRSAVVAPSISDDQDPAAKISWGFVELTYKDETEVRDGGNRLYANLSFVDWVGIVLGMSVKPRPGSPGDPKTRIIPGLTGPGGQNPEKALGAICKELKDLGANDKRLAWWGELCVTGDKDQPLRILAPNIYNHPAKTRSPEFLKYWDGYVDKVWARYKDPKKPLRVNTQLQAGTGMEALNGTGATCDCVTGAGEAGSMRCSCPVIEGQGGGRDFTFARPATGDIFSCNTGAFAPVLDASEQKFRQLRARLCATFVRSTLLLPDELGSLTPNKAVTAKQYYSDVTTDYYSKVVHKYLKDGKGYTFSFDDVDPGTENAAGVIEMEDPQVMNVVVGGWVEGDEKLGMQE
ncbi:hypothetical protein Micbo1qcDRAFT_192192 [Microdochium bolleyi]|uniref:GH64 domain-containing protein n=1 Tax=Microdochium bolleyi TaxID=196109 RepID=A0A136JD35_9PEZI|nr:hypothetical protein Micbo1qcDRAFT_192192 [Microdochium bolleyi]